MNDFSQNSLFDLSKFAHADLFEGCVYAWEALPKIHQYLLSLTLGMIEAEIPEGVVLVNPELIRIESGALIEPGVYIRGPCYISKGAEVRFGAYLRGDVIVGCGAVVGHGTEVKNAIFMNKAHAGHFAYVGDSILGYDVNLGAGTKLANLKLSRKEITLKSKGAILNTHLRKFGALMGDGSQTGCNCVTNPGTVMGKKAMAYPCTNISGFIPAEHLFNHEGRLVPFAKEIN